MPDNNKSTIQCHICKSLKKIRPRIEARIAAEPHESCGTNCIACKEQKNRQEADLKTVDYLFEKISNDSPITDIEYKQLMWLLDNY